MIKIKKTNNDFNIYDKYCGKITCSEEELKNLYKEIKKILNKERRSFKWQ